MLKLGYGKRRAPKRKKKNSGTRQHEIDDLRPWNWTQLKWVGFVPECIDDVPLMTESWPTKTSALETGF
jgi:hypothetical protein